jgi:hypothetical protein
MIPDGVLKAISLQSADTCPFLYPYCVTEKGNCPNTEHTGKWPETALYRSLLN